MTNTTIYLDIGHFQTRVLCGDSKHIYPSLAARSAIPSNQVDAQLKEPQYRVISPGHWLIGELAKAEMIGEPATGAQWPMGEAYKALFYSALAATTRAHKSEIEVWTGLPHQSLYLKSRVKGWMHKTHTVQLRGRREQKFVVKKVSILDQGTATFLATILNARGEWEDDYDDEMESSVIDFGSRTTIYTTLTGYHRAQKYTLSTDTGAWNIEAAIRQELDRRWGGYADRLSSHTVMKIATSKVMAYRGQQKDVSDLVNPILQVHADDIISQSQRLWQQAEARRVFIGGGGWDLLHPYLQKIYPHIEKVRFPIWGQCIGEQRLHLHLMNGS